MQAAMAHMVVMALQAAIIHQIRVDTAMMETGLITAIHMAILELSGDLDHLDLDTARTAMVVTDSAKTCLAMMRQDSILKQLITI